MCTEKKIDLLYDDDDDDGIVEITTQDKTLPYIGDEDEVTIVNDIEIDRHTKLLEISSKQDLAPTEILSISILLLGEMLTQQLGRTFSLM